jgi:hypothetical protein
MEKPAKGGATAIAIVVAVEKERGPAPTAED